MFVETVKTKLSSTTISQFGNGFSTYLTHFHDNLSLINAKEDSCEKHNDLITYIFSTLSASNVAPFKEEVQKWHAGLWIESKPPAIITLKLELESQKQSQQQLAQPIVAHLTKLSKWQQRPLGPSGYQHPL